MDGGIELKIEPASPMRLAFYRQLWLDFCGNFPSYLCEVLRCYEYINVITRRAAINSNGVFCW